MAAATSGLRSAPQLARTKDLQLPQAASLRWQGRAHHLPRLGGMRDYTAQIKHGEMSRRRSQWRAGFMAAFGPVILALLLAALPASAANAAQSKHRKPKQAPKAELIDCTKYGPGFVRIGADGCIKIGGSIDVDAGRNGK